MSRRLGRRFKARPLDQLRKDREKERAMAQDYGGDLDAVRQLAGLPRPTPPPPAPRGVAQRVRAVIAKVEEALE